MPGTPDPPDWLNRIIASSFQLSPKTFVAEPPHGDKQNAEHEPHKTCLVMNKGTSSPILVGEILTAFGHTSESTFNKKCVSNTLSHRVSFIWRQYRSAGFLSWHFVNYTFLTFVCPPEMQV